MNLVNQYLYLLFDFINIININYLLNRLSCQNSSQPFIKGLTPILYNIMCPILTFTQRNKMRVATKKSVYKDNYLKTLERALYISGMTHSEIAKKIDMSLPTVSQVLSGQNTNYRTVKKACDALGINFSTILK